MLFIANFQGNIIQKSTAHTHANRKNWKVASDILNKDVQKLLMSSTICKKV